MLNAYWNNQGAEQSKYDEMTAADFEFTQATEKVFHSYYRYYNDGDLPGWARGDYYNTKQSFEYGYAHRVLNDHGEEMLENKVTDAILKEYKRFQKAIKK